MAATTNRIGLLGGLLIDSSSDPVLLVEGGGSHTSAFVIHNGEILLSQHLPSLNRVGRSDGTNRMVLADVVQVGRRYGQPKAYFALGAAATFAYLEGIAAELREVWTESGMSWDGNIITNDIVPLMFAEEEDSNQLIVISGTGSGIAGRKSFSHVVRAGAHEYLLGDEGGAFAIGRAGLNAVYRAREERGKKTLLEELACQWTDSQEIDWFVYESENPKQTVASFARLVFEADKGGDEISSQILDQAAMDLAAVCDGALAQMDWPKDIKVTLTGSLLTEGSGRLRTRFERIMDSRPGICSFSTESVRADLLYRTALRLWAEPKKLDAISLAIPSKRG